MSEEFTIATTTTSIWKKLGKELQKSHSITNFDLDMIDWDWPIDGSRLGTNWFEWILQLYGIESNELTSKVLLYMSKL